MSTYSTNLALELIGNGEQAGNWGQTTNTNLGTLVEQAISGYTTQAITDGADTTLTMTQGASATARNMTIELTGTLTAARNLIVPSNRKLYFIYNNTSGGFAVTVKVSGQTGVSVPNGSKLILTSNGTDIVNATSYVTSSGGGGTVTSVSGTGSVSGLTLSGTVTTTGSLTLGGSITGFATTSSNTFSGANTFSSTLTASQTVNLSGSGYYVNTYGKLSCITQANGASFGTASPDGNYAVWARCHPSASAGAGVVTQSGGVSDAACGLACTTTTTSTQLIVFYYGNYPTASLVGTITTNGSATAYNTSSDYRLKENVAPLVNAVARLKQIAPKNFTWKNNPSLGTVEGFIAHELQEVVPEAVFGEKDALDKDGKPAYQGVDSSFLVPLLTAALQEAFTRIEALEAKVG
jgi:hypothetical protein